MSTMLNVTLDPETEQQLADILAYEKAVNHSDLVKRLIRERWLTLKLDITFVERRGGHPQHLLQGAPPDLSERVTRKQAIADYSDPKSFVNLFLLPPLGKGRVGVG